MYYKNFWFTWKILRDDNFWAAHVPLWKWQTGSEWWPLLKSVTLLVCSDFHSLPIFLLIILYDAFGPLYLQALQKVEQHNWQKPVKNKILGLYSKSCKQTSSFLPQSCYGWPVTAAGSFNLLSHVTLPWAWGYMSAKPQRSQPDPDSTANIIPLSQVDMWSPSSW